jgi:hypothetical protein
LSYIDGEKKKNKELNSQSGLYKMKMVFVKKQERKKELNCQSGLYKMKRVFVLVKESDGQILSIAI